ncbi:hypothetical protein Taro_048260, partial [Colocasia esculenta]|nr:hypothetical protein [Colocasia esculenta]
LSTALFGLIPNPMLCNKSI